MPKATHNGHCQVCGRTQAVNPKTGKLAKHGYTVDYGFFSGICSGSDQLPLENNFEKFLGLQNYRQAMADNLAAITVSDISVIEVDFRSNDEMVELHRYAGHGRTSKLVSREDYIKQFGVASYVAAAWDQKAQYTVDQKHRQAEFLLRDKEQMQQLKNKVYGKELLERS